MSSPFLPQRNGAGSGGLALAKDKILIRMAFDSSENTFTTDIKKKLAKMTKTICFNPISHCPGHI
jgi:hypothetical protein